MDQPIVSASGAQTALWVVSCRVKASPGTIQTYMGHKICSSGMTKSRNRVCLNGPYILLFFCLKINGLLNFFEKLKPNRFFFKSSLRSKSGRVILLSVKLESKSLCAMHRVGDRFTWVRGLNSIFSLNSWISSSPNFTNPNRRFVFSNRITNPSFSSFHPASHGVKD